jgi:hypothetical protein
MMRRKKWIASAAVGLVAGMTSFALADARIEERDAGEMWFVRVDAIPTNLDEVRALRDQLCTTPHGAMVPFVVAGIIFGENRELGEQCMVLSVDPELLGETIKARDADRRANVDGWQLGGRVLAMLNSTSFQADIPYVGRSYVEGTRAENGYALPDPPYQFVVRKHRTQMPDPKLWKGFLNCMGATGPKPFDVKEISPGVWRMSNTSSFFAGCADPPAQGPPRGPR